MSVAKYFAHRIANKVLPYRFYTSKDGLKIFCGESISIIPRENDHRKNNHPIIALFFLFRFKGLNSLKTLTVTSDQIVLGIISAMISNISKKLSVVEERTGSQVLVIEKLDLKIKS